MARRRRTRMRCGRGITRFQLDWFGDVGKLVSEIGHFEKSTFRRRPHLIHRSPYAGRAFHSWLFSDIAQQPAASARRVRRERTDVLTIGIRTTGRDGLEERSEDRGMSQDGMGAR
jgi:hypothetical protein